VNDVFLFLAQGVPLLDDERLRALLSAHVEGRKTGEHGEAEGQRGRERDRTDRKADGRERTE